MNLNQKTVRLSRLALFSALILLLNYTPLGYIRVFALEITLIIIPVTLGAMLLGPADGAILGGVFGLTSFATCFGSSQFGVTLLAINPIGTFITCVVARVLAGGLTGLVFERLHRSEKLRPISYAVGGLLGPGVQYPVLHELHRAVLLEHRVYPGHGCHHGRRQSPDLRGAVRGHQCSL